MSDITHGFEEPDALLVTRALTRIGDIHHRRAFFAGLQNPLWLDPLDAHGMFDIDPDRTPVGPGLLRPWPEGDYLVRMASIAPDKVADVLVRHLNTDDLVVRATILQAAAVMPAGAAARLADGIAGFLNGPMHFDHEPIVHLIENLFAGGQSKKARQLVDSLYAPKPGRNTDDGGGGQAPAGLEPYWYAQTLPRVARAMVGADPRSLSGVAQWLASYQLASGKYVETSDHDVSDSWRPSIRPHEQNWGFDDVGNALVDVLRDLARDQLAAGVPPAEVVERVRRPGQPIHVRVAMDALAQVLENDPASWARVGDIVSDLVLDPKHLDPPYWRETLLLTRVALSHLSQEQLRLFVAAAMSGPAAPDAELAEWLKWRVGDGSENPTPNEDLLKEEVENYRKRWRLRLLAGIGRDHLVAELVDEFDRLQQEVPIPEHPDFTSWHKVDWTGPASPVEVDDLLAMADGALVAHLLTWRPTETDSHFGHSGLGQARALEEAASRSPERLAALLPELIEAPINYLGSALRGLERALEGQNQFPWEPVLRVCLAVAMQPDAPTDDSRTFGDDPSWTWAKRQVAALLRRGADEATWSPAEADTASFVLETLAGHPDPSFDRERGDEATQMDSLTLSLNSVRPEALRALLKLLTNDLWPETRSRIHRALELHQGKEADPSLAVAAVFGQSLGQLVGSDRDREWLSSSLERLLGDPDKPLDADSEYIDTVWSVMLTSYRPHLTLVEALRPWWMRAIKDLSTSRAVTEGWRGQRGQRAQLGDHLVTLVVRGQLTPDDQLVREYFANADVATRSDVLGHLGWALMRAEEIDDAFLERAKALVTSRAAAAVGELDQFAWWTRIKQLSPEWWLPLLAQAVASPTFNDRRMVSEPLAAASRTAPAIALDVLDRLLKRRDDEHPWRRYDLIEAAPTIIAAAMDAGSSSLVGKALALMDSLGREGFLDVRTRVEAARERFRNNDGDAR